jgi:predicted nuclease of restriction endonuclease-like RecB superfamily
LTYGRKNLKLLYIHGKIYPFYLDIEKHRDLINDVIRFYLDNEGKRFSDIDWDELRIIIGDDRLYNAIKRTMSYFFKPVKLHRVDVDPKILRLRVFQLVNTMFDGFIPQDRREEAVEVIKDEIGLEGDLDKILWIDDPNELQLARVSNPSIEDIVKMFNFETIDTVCVNSSKIAIEVNRYEKLLSSIVRAVGRFSKLYGLIYDMRYYGDILKIVVEGPRSLFRRPTVYGSRLSLLISRIIDMLYSSSFWRVEAEMHLTKRVISVEVLSYRLKPYIASKSIEEEVKQVFDSSIEESIYRVLKSLGIDIKREEEPIALGQLLYLPDFKIYRNGNVFYVEVAGFWRKEYAEKKAYKLYEVSKILNNLIVIADENLRPFFKKLNIPIIYYTIVHGKPILPYKKIIDIINQKT